MTVNNIIPAVHTSKKPVAVNSTKTAIHIEFSTLCTAAVNVDTE